MSVGTPIPAMRDDPPSEYRFLLFVLCLVTAAVGVYAWWRLAAYFDIV